MLFFESDDFEERRLREARRRAKRMQKRRAAAFRSVLAVFSLILLSTSLWAIRRLYFFDRARPFLPSEKVSISGHNRKVQNAVSAEEAGSDAQDSFPDSKLSQEQGSWSGGERAAQDNGNVSSTSSLPVSMDRNNETRAETPTFHASRNSSQMPGSTQGSDPITVTGIKQAEEKGRIDSEASDESRRPLKPPELLKPSSERSSSESSSEDTAGAKRQQEKEEGNISDEREELIDVIEDEEGGKAPIITLGKSARSDDDEDDDEAEGSEAHRKTKTQ